MKRRSARPSFQVPTAPFVEWLAGNGFARCSAVRFRGAKAWKRLRQKACCEWSGDLQLIMFVVPNRGPIDAAAEPFQSRFRDLANELGVPPRELFLSIWPEVKCEAKP